MKTLYVAVLLGGITSVGIWGGIQAIDTMQSSDSVQIQAGRTNVHSGGHNQPRNGGNQTTSSCHCHRG